MKILYVCRLYSGFEESCKTKHWKPKGTPTVARMLETLDQSDEYDLKLIFTTKDYNSGWDKINDVELDLNGMNSKISVLAGKNYFPVWLWKFQEKLSDLRQFWIIYKTAKSFKPDLIYCDRANIFPAAMLSRLTNIPVIWRVLGVLDIMKQAARSQSLRGIVLRYLWRSPFAYVICSMDGSGGNIWMDQVLKLNTPRKLLLNGFDFNEAPDKNLKIASSPLNILFAGRLEPLKNADIFLEIALKHLNEYSEHRVYFAGYGSELNKLQRRAAETIHHNKITFLGALTPSEMKAARQQCDIHVSMNEHGNLTNVNLEAIADGLVVIVPNSRPDKGVDTDTDTFIPKDVFYRYGDLHDNQAVLKALEIFVNDNTLHEWKTRSKQFAQEHLTSWDERIQQELKIFHCTVHDISS